MLTHERDLLARKGRRVRARAIPHMDAAGEACQQRQPARVAIAAELTSPVALLEEFDHEPTEALIDEAFACSMRALLVAHVHEHLGHARA